MQGSRGSRQRGVVRKRSWDIRNSSESVTRVTRSSQHGRTTNACAPMPTPHTAIDHPSVGITAEPRNPPATTVGSYFQLEVTVLVCV